MLTKHHLAQLKVASAYKKLVVLIRELSEWDDVGLTLHKQVRKAK